MPEGETLTISVQLLDEFNNVVEEDDHTVALTASPEIGNFSYVV